MKVGDSETWYVLRYFKGSGHKTRRDSDLTALKEYADRNVPVGERYDITRVNETIIVIGEKKA